MAEWSEQLKVEGQHLVATITELIHAGNVRHIIIRHDGHTVFEIPVTIGVAAVVIAPILAAVGAAGALLTNCTVEVIRTDSHTPDDVTPPRGL